MTEPARLMTSKSQVLAVHPRAYAEQSEGAWHIWHDVDSLLAQDDETGIIGRGYSAIEAWRDAAGRL